MTTVSLSTFDRLKSKGVASFQEGDYLAAKTYLVDAAECIIGIAQDTKSVEARRQHEELAAELIELVRECDRRVGAGMQGNPPQSPLVKGGGRTAAGGGGKKGPHSGPYDREGGRGGGDPPQSPLGKGGGRNPLRSPLGKGEAGGKKGPHSGPYQKEERPHTGRVGTAHQGGRVGGNRQGAKDDDEGPDAEDWIVRNKPSVGFDDIAGLEDVKNEIRLKMIYPFSHAELAARYGIPVGGGILLYGPPGTGKTMIAKAIATEIDATFFLVSPAQMMSKWVGEAEQNIRKLFDAAKAEPKSVIFLDELEALVPKRKSDSSTVMQRVVPQILQELEGFDRAADRALLFVGATNRPWMLDEAVLRPGRLDAKVYIGLPDAPARFKLLEIHFGDRPVADDVDFGVLCDKLDGYSGADIKNLAHEAAERPFLEAVGGQAPRPIAMADIQSVIAANPPSVHPSDLVRFEKFAREGQ